MKSITKGVFTMTMRSLTTPLLAFLLVACSSTGVVPTGGDTYMAAKSGGGFVSDMTADIFREAAAFCADQKKKLEKINLTEQNNIPFVRRANSKLEFRCI